MRQSDTSNKHTLFIGHCDRSIFQGLAILHYTINTIERIGIIFGIEGQSDTLNDSFLFVDHRDIYVMV